MGTLSGGTSNKTSTTTNPYAVQQYQDASSSLPTSYSTLNSSQIQNYENPYTSSVVNATDAENAQAEQQQLNNNTDQAIKSGAFDSNGPSVANALTQGQFALANNETNAQLNQANYSQALSTAQTQNAAQNQYPLAVQQLLGSLASGTTQNTNSTQNQLGLSLSGSYDPVSDFSAGGG